MKPHDGTGVTMDQSDALRDLWNVTVTFCWTRVLATVVVVGVRVSSAL